jgi:hypothetical protein
LIVARPGLKDRCPNPHRKRDWKLRNSKIPAQSTDGGRVIPYLLLLTQDSSR